LEIRIGFGYDIHRLVKRRKLFLGGIEIPFPKGLLGHSDGDCLIHAIIDALLGIIGEKDIGQVFPDTDKKYKDVRSTEILEQIMDELASKKTQIVNCDCTIIAEKPKLSFFIPRMKEILCPILKIGKYDLSIKAKTNEGLGLVGKGKAVVAMASVLVNIGNKSFP